MNCKWEIKLFLIRAEAGWKWYIMEDDNAWNLMLEATAYGSLEFIVGWAKDNVMTLDETIEEYTEFIKMQQG